MDIPVFTSCISAGRRGFWGVEAGFEGRGLTKSRSLGMTVSQSLYLWSSKCRMQALANVSIGTMFCMYVPTASFGYLTFYSEWGWGQC